ncbi:MAG: M20/M25/M40 family metallo-hydrolase [Vicinamibacterales bacterium]
MSRRLIGPVLAGSLVVAVSAAPQQPPAPQNLTVWVPHTVAPETIDTDTNAKIRAEGMEHSKIMWIEHNLTDVYGPRPIGSPNHKAAADWAVKTMTSWGMKNAHLEPFTWRGVGWLPGRATGFITSPVKANIKFEAIPWTPSTNGTVSGDVVQILPPESPTEAEMTAFLTALAPKVKGGIVMVGASVTPPVNFNEAQKRIPDEQAKARYLPPDPNAPARGGRGGRGGGRGGPGGAPAPEGHLSAQQVNARITALLRDNPPALRLTQQGGGRIPGVIVAQNGAGQTYEPASQISPGVILRNDDYGRISRLIADGTPVSVEFNVANQYFPEGTTSYVTVGEIPGTDKADEVVMLGGHLDSWTSATGATDNAIGCAIMLEAARILETVGAKPRRTIRVALWSGEEEGLLGSFDYVKRHFGSAEAPLSEYAKLDAYWNIDDGTGRVRGANIFGPPEAAIVLAQFLKPFEDWGIYGASASSARVEGGSDNGAFAVAGLPGIGAQQDPIEYNSTTWHTDLDNYERIVPDDVMKNAIVSAAVVYSIANRDKMMPRFAASDMPPVPAGRGGGAGRGGAAAADPHVFLVPKGKALTVAAPGLAGVTAGATAITTPPAMVAVGTSPAHGKLELKADGSFVYTPERGFTGTDSFTYTTTRNAATSTPGTVTLIVQ